ADQASTYAQRCNDEELRRGAELDFGYAEMLAEDFSSAETRFRTLLTLEEEGGNPERIGNRSGDVALAVMNHAIRSDGVAEKEALCQQARQLVEHGLTLGNQINHTVMVAEAEIFLAIIWRVLANEGEYRRLIERGHDRFRKLGIDRPGRAEQFIDFPNGLN
ncbi:hypothetical protein, partial [Streptomyces sp. bgisy034]|uniref:hypothetical protein n=1 Tax=Streptomyces sp. bgisy034 TaxID=3413774 RepID=UPI003EB85F2F